MKKTLTLSTIFLFCMCINDTKAQVSLGVNLGMFNGLSSDSDTRFGLNISSKKSINEKIRIGANIGYYFKSYDFSGTKLTAFTMPITGLFEYSLNKRYFSPYIGSDIGIYRFGLSGEGETIAKAYFGLASVVGFNYKLSDKLLLNGNLKYNSIFTEGESTSAISINAGISYKF